MPHHHHQSHHTTQCCSCCCCRPSSPPPPPPTTTTTTTSSDQLLQLLAGHLLLQPHHPQPLIHHQYPKSQPQPQPHPQQTHHHDDRQQTQTLLHSLLRRVAALESSLPTLPPSSPRRRPPSPTPHPPPPPPPSPPVSLRSLAATTIQSHFRRFLVRRSQTLRHLKHLAAIESQAADIKSSLSRKNAPNPKSISNGVMDLLLELDSIQGTDLMVREGRRAISRELARILEFVDKVLNREPPMEFVAAAPKPSRRVSFAEIGEDETRVSCHEPSIEEMIDGGGDGGNVVNLRDRVRRLSRELEEIEGFSRVLEENGELSDGEKVPNGVGYGQDGDHGLYAPLPVQMEPRRGESKKKVVSR